MTPGTSMGARPSRRVWWSRMAGMTWRSERVRRWAKVCCPVCCWVRSRPPAGREASAPRAAATATARSAQSAVASNVTATMVRVFRIGTERKSRRGNSIQYGAYRNIVKNDGPRQVLALIVRRSLVGVPRCPFGSACGRFLAPGVEAGEHFAGDAARRGVDDFVDDLVGNGAFL